MNEIQQFLYNKSFTPYGVGMLSPDEAIEFVNLCKKYKLPIYGFEGFHKRTDISPSAIQIDQAYSANYSELDPSEAYDLALEFFQNHKEDNILYQITYDYITPDYNIVRSYKENNKKS